MMLGAVVMSFALIASACGDKSDDVTGGDSTAAPDTTAAGGTDTTEAGGGDTTAAPTTAPQETLPPVAEPVLGGKLVVSVEGETTSPWLPAEMQCAAACQMRARTFFDPIVAIDEDLNWRPFLAESVEANADSTVFTIKVREGITFHDGTPLTADAMILAMNKAINSLLVGAAVKDIARVDGEAVIEKIDDMTFTIATGKDGDPAQPISWPLFPYYLGGQAGLIASPDWLNAVDAGTADPTEAVGTGPFTLESYTPGDQMIVKKNPNYWLKDANGTQLPYLDEIEFRVIADSQVAGTALESGDINMFHTSDAGVVGDFSENESFTTLEQNQYGETNYVLMNLTKPYLADKSVRCALTQAVDKIDLINVIAGGNADPANGMFSPGQEGFLTENGSLGYDPDAAAAAIEAYEAANGPLTINYSTTTAATSLATAQYLQNAWSQIGVDVTITQIEQSVLINNALLGDAAFDAFGWRNHAGVFFDQQYFWWHGSAALPPGQLALNFGRLNDPKLNELLEKSRSEADPDVRRGYAEEANRLFASECYVIPTSYTKWAVISDPTVQGIGGTPQADGEGFLRDGAGFPGQVWLTAVFIDG
jgi:peptide/nickel transport system substrate-binding protein